MTNTEHLVISLLVFCRLLYFMFILDVPAVPPLDVVLRKIEYDLKGFEANACDFSLDHLVQKLVQLSVPHDRVEQQKVLVVHTVYHQIKQVHFLQKVYLVLIHLA